MGGLKPELVDVWSQRCAFVVDEILRTERDYVDSLHDIIQVLLASLVIPLVMHPYVIQLHSACHCVSVCEHHLSFRNIAHIHNYGFICRSFLPL